jgi:hypothetical protein
MSKQLLREYYELCDGGICQDFLTEGEKRRISEGATILTGCLQKFGEKNGNGRIYPEKTLRREVENYKKVVDDRRSVGELDHPDDSVVNLKNVSHLVTDIWMDGNKVMGKLEVLPTPAGDILKGLVNAGVKIGISSRGLGSVRESLGGTMVNEDFQLICFDVVQEPSTPGAFIGPSTRVSFGMNENTTKNVLRATKDQIILSKIYDLVGI